MGGKVRMLPQFYNWQRALCSATGARSPSNSRTPASRELPPQKGGLKHAQEKSCHRGRCQICGSCHVSLDARSSQHFAPISTGSATSMRRLSELRQTTVRQRATQDNTSGSSAALANAAPRTSYDTRRASRPALRRGRERERIW
eukprot:33659-Pyramimonas_sp.AAC.1